MFSKPIDLLDLVYLLMAITFLMLVSSTGFMGIYGTFKKWELKEAEFLYQCNVTELKRDER